MPFIIISGVSDAEQQVLEKLRYRVVIAACVSMDVEKHTVVVMMPPDLLPHSEDESQGGNTVLV